MSDAFSEASDDLGALLCGDDHSSMEEGSLTTTEEHTRPALLAHSPFFLQPDGRRVPNLRHPGVASVSGGPFQCRPTFYFFHSRCFEIGRWGGGGLGGEQQGR